MITVDTVDGAVQPAVLPAQVRQLTRLRSRKPAVLAGARVPLSLLDPLPHGGLGQVEVPRDLPDRPVLAGTSPLSRH
jgi:hypothetical protein